MPAKPNERQYRMMAAPLCTARAARGGGDEKAFDTEFYAEGYASTFDDPYVLFRDMAGTEFYEVVSPDAFEGADMSDVIMQYDHEGRVLARMSNGTLLVKPDGHGLFVAADLGGSQAARALHEEIACGLVTRMSWAFTVAEEAYDRKTRTTTITRVDKVFDVSAVSYPADPNTEISARNLLDGAILRAHEERVRRRRALACARAKVAILAKGR